jgi:hypothetical protein
MRSPWVASPYFPYRLAFEHPRPPSSAKDGAVGTNVTIAAAAFKNPALILATPFVHEKSNALMVTDELGATIGHGAARDTQREGSKNSQIVPKSSKLNRLDGLASGKRWD